MKEVTKYASSWTPPKENGFDGISTCDELLGMYENALDVFSKLDSAYMSQNWVVAVNLGLTANELFRRLRGKLNEVGKHIDNDLKTVNKLISDAQKAQKK